MSSSTEKRSKCFDDYDCVTSLCRSSKHGDMLTATLTKRDITFEELIVYISQYCGSCHSVQDSVGRTLLHVAASLGLSNFVEWLINYRRADIDTKDRESGYTALHRSIFYGQIHTAVSLIKHGAKLNILDHDFLSYLDLAAKDCNVDYSLGQDCEVYMWGSNANYTLGMQEGKKHPELLSKLNLDTYVKNVCIEKFHCVILSKTGDVFSCGHGHGGRLGLPVSSTVIKPTQVNFPLRGALVKQISIGRDHSMFLMDSSTVWTCGLNQNYVLGLSPPPPMVLEPKIINEIKESITGISAGRHHSAAWSNETTPPTLLMWGINGGQLGMDESVGDSVITPKEAIKLNPKGLKIVDVITTDSATVVQFIGGSIHVFQDFQLRKIFYHRPNEIVRICATGGRLSQKFQHKCNPQPLNILAITASGNIYLWNESSSQLTRCIFSLHRHLFITDAVLNKTGLLFITRDGEAFEGTVKKRLIKPVERNKQVSEFHKFLEKHACEMINVSRLKNVHRGVKVVSDSSGKNFAVLQTEPRFFSSKQCDAPTAIEQEYCSFFKSINGMDALHDICLKVGGKEFFAHKFIILSNSRYFDDVINSNIVEISNITAEIFSEILQFIYTKKCNLVEKLCTNHTNDKKDANGHTSNQQKLRALKSAAKLLKLSDLLDYADSIQSKKLHFKNFYYKRMNYSGLYDVKIKCSNGEFRAHKCILAARSEYYNNLFGLRWSGNSKDLEIHLPISVKLSQIIIDFLYTDSSREIDKECDIQKLSNILIIADQLLIMRLKQICELNLIKKLTLRNIGEILQFADIYNCGQLKNCCFEFICMNLPAVIESRVLEMVEESVLKELTNYYLETHKQFQSRIITPYSTAPDDQVIKSFYETNQHLIKDIFEVNNNIVTAKKKLRLRRNTKSESQNTTEPIELPISPIEEYDNKKEWRTVNSPQQTVVLARLRANAIIRQENPTATDTFTKLTPPVSDSFPELSSSSKINHIKSPPNKSISNKKIVKVSQKQRKKLKSESDLDVESKNIIQPVKDNPWKKIEPLEVVDTVVSFPIILENEQRKRDNLVRMKTRPLHLTQIEDIAIEEIKRFYNVDNVFEENLTVSRVAQTNIAAPVWVTGKHN